MFVSPQNYNRDTGTITFGLKDFIGVGYDIPIVVLSEEDKELLKRAETGDVTLLRRDDVATLKDHFGETLLHKLAAAGCSAVLEHPMIVGVATYDGTTPLHKLAGAGCSEALQHPLVGFVKNMQGRTPLHLLAMKKCEGLLKHPDAAKVKDPKGKTPLHYLAYEGVESVLQHPMADTILDDFGWTPTETFHEVKKNGKDRIVYDEGILSKVLPSYRESFILRSATNRPRRKPDEIWER